MGSLNRLFFPAPRRVSICLTRMHTTNIKLSMWQVDKPCHSLIFIDAIAAKWRRWRRICHYIRSDTLDRGTDFLLASGSSFEPSVAQAHALFTLAAEGEGVDTLWVLDFYLQFEEEEWHTNSLQIDLGSLHLCVHNDFYRFWIRAENRRIGWQASNPILDPVYCQWGLI